VFFLSRRTKERIKLNLIKNAQTYYVKNLKNEEKKVEYRKIRFNKLRIRSSYNK